MTVNAIAFLPLYVPRSLAVRPAFVPIIAAAASAAVTWHWGLLPVLDKESTLALGGAAASFGATMMGFMLAALAVLASINHVHLVQMMRKTGHYRQLLTTIFAGSVAMLGCAILGLILLVSGCAAAPAMLYAVVALHAAALASLIATGFQFWLVLGHLTND